MSTTTVQEHDQQQTPNRRESRDVFRQVSDLSANCRSATVFYCQSIEIISQQFGARFGSIVVSNPAESVDEHASVGDTDQTVWKRLSHAILLESQTDGVAIARLYDIDGTDLRVALLAVPLRDEQGYTGAMALVVPCEDRAAAEKALFELKSLAALLCSVVPTSHMATDSGSPGSDSVQTAMARAARYGSLTELAFAMTNSLKTKFQCDQVVLGHATKSRVQLLSLSSMDALHPRSPGTRLIRQAMEECLDCGNVIYTRPKGGWSYHEGNDDYRLHHQWRSAIGDAAILSVPLLSNDECVAVVSLVRPGGVGFQSEEVDQIKQLVTPYGPAVQLVARASRGWLAQTRDTVRSGLGWLLEGQSWGRKLVAASFILFVTWFCIGSIEYRLSTPCEIVPTSIQHFAAPFQGVIRSAYVEVGDQVKSGQLLFQMDTRALELERRELEMEASVQKLEVAQALANDHMEQAAVAQARLQVTKAKMDSMDRQIALACVRAPADGTIMAGDVRMRVGDVVSISESLIEFAPIGAWAVELHVPGRDAQNVRPGQEGQFVTIARPDQAIRCVVEQVEPTATVVDGNNVFVTRANVSAQAGSSLAGMDGMATLKVGRRRVWWVALHRVIDFVRLNYWI